VCVTYIVHISHFILLQSNGNKSFENKGQQPSHFAAFSIESMA